jgi:hypothetical protein
MENGIKKKNVTIRIDPELLNKIKNIIYANHGWILNGFIEDTLREKVESMKQCDPRPEKNLKPGRRIIFYL